MEPFLLLLGLAVLAIPPAVVYLLISNAGLRQRVKRLEDQLATGAAASPAQSKPPAPKPQPAAFSQPKPTPEPADTPGVKETPTQPPQEAIVLTKKNANALVTWLTKNWYYAVAAASLALAGIFVVQYGIEQGLLPPLVRVLAALGFGVLLVGVGELIRRRFGDMEDSSAAFLPSTFSSAGIVTLFGAILSARLLYGFIGPEVALGGMALVGVLAMVLGWFYGPLLAAVGIIGATVAPFIVGGSSEDPSGLLAYFAIIVIAGLAIDSIQRWAWVSVLALALGFGAATLLFLSAQRQTGQAFMLYCCTIALASIGIPVQRFFPDHGGAALLLRPWDVAKKTPWPDFPTRLAGGSVLAASGLTLFCLFMLQTQPAFWIAVALLTTLACALLIWAKGAPAIADLVVFPLAALLGTVPLGISVWQADAAAWAAPDGTLPLSASILVALGLALSIIAAWRSLRGGRENVFMAAVAALFAPALAILMEVFWKPSATFTNYGWALHALIIAIVMMGMAERFHKADGNTDRLRVSMAALSGLAAIAFALVILFSSAALTLALTLTLVGAAALDRRFNLPLMSAYLLIGVPAIMFRLVVDPGLDWARAAPLFDVLLSHGGAVAGFAAALLLLGKQERPNARVMVDSALFSSLGILVSTLLYRAIVAWGGESAAESHWFLGLGAGIWLALAITQIRRAQLGGVLKDLRTALGAVFLLLGGAALFAALTFANPLFSGAQATVVLGVPLFNTLIAAYLLPAGVLWIGGRWSGALPKELSKGLAILALALSAIWAVLCVRHAWRGGEAMVLPGNGDGELYTYTVMLIVLGAALIVQSIRKHEALLRKAGLAVIALAALKVFLIDISGLSGLVRVFSLLLLGLSLAGLAWLNRWAEGQTQAEPNDAPSK